MNATPRPRIRLLGATVISETPGRPLTAPRPVALLAYLLLARPRGLHSRDTLTALLWPELTADTARHALRNALHALRTSLGAGAIVSRGDGLVGIDASRVECDVHALEDALAHDRDVAIARYEGELMQGFHLGRTPEFEHWLDAERRRLHESVRRAAWSIADSLRLTGPAADSAAAARRAYALAPDDEASLRRLVEHLEHVGDRAAALRAYEDFVERTARNGDLEPDRDTHRLVREVRARHDRSADVLHVRGTFLFLRAAASGDAAELERSRACFEQALERDPRYAPAYAGLSNYYAVAARRGVLRPFDDTFAKAIELSRRAMALDPTLAVPHVHFGVQAMYLDANWDAAGRHFSRAASLEPDYAEGRRFYGVWLAAMGRTSESLAELRAAARIEPQIVMFHNSLAAGLMDARDYDGALASLDRALTLDPAYAAARDRRIRCYERLGRWSDAVAERARRGLPADAPFAAAYASDGEAGYRRARADELRAVARALESRLTASDERTVDDRFLLPELRLALCLAELGDHERARAWEERACAQNAEYRRWFRSHPDLNASVSLHP